MRKVDKQQRWGAVDCLAIEGVRGVLATVECVATRNLPGFHIVGLPSASVREAKERVLAAIHASGMQLPSLRYTWNLRPANLPKEGSAYDLALALSCLIAAKILPSDVLKRCLALGELSLRGEILSTSATSFLPGYLQSDPRGAVIIPEEDISRWTGPYPAQGGAFASLAAVVEHIRTQQSANFPTPNAVPSPNYSHPTDATVQNLPLALAVALAGEHHLLLMGAAGVGKTTLAKRAQEQQLPFSEEERAEVQAIYAAASLPMPAHRPFRNPHYSASAAGILGGGVNCTPGEITLAHRGILFLDEFLEFPRHVLEQLRTPMETGNICHARVRKHLTLPARFQLIAATNLCPCGNLGGVRACRCERAAAKAYQFRLSQALLERFDLHLMLSLNDADHCSKESLLSAQQILHARQRMLRRQKKANAWLRGDEVFSVMPWENSARDFLLGAQKNLGLSHRSVQALARVALSLADIYERNSVCLTQIQEVEKLRALHWESFDHSKVGEPDVAKPESIRSVCRS